MLNDDVILTKRLKQCLECGKFVSRNLGKHLHKHGLDSKSYYDKYFKKDGEGVCPICGGDTEFYKPLYGYRQYCSDECKKEGSKRKFGSYNIIERKLLKHVLKNLMVK